MDTNKLLLIVAILLCGATGYYSYKTSEDVKELRIQMNNTSHKLDSLMTATAKIAKSTKTVAANKQPKSFWEALFSEIEADEKANVAEKKAKAARAKVTVSDSYRLEDRYVVGNVKLPEYMGTQSGRIIVNIFVDEYGTVKKTSIAEGTTITDQEVIESARRAALKTDFNSNYDMREPEQGTITYTFRKK